MSSYTNSMFDSIKTALSDANTKNKGGLYREILKLTPGNTYIVRLLPNVADPKKTFFHYYTHAWESFATGNYTAEVSPQTWGERDPIGEDRLSISKHGTEEEKDKAKAIMRRENWLVNAYVVNDPVNQDNNGKVKLIRFGRQLHKIIMEAIEGEDAEEFGARIFDLSSSGCNFKIKCEKQGDFPTYVSSRFAPPAEVAGLDDDNIQEVYDNIHDLESVFPVKSYDDLKKVLDEHFHCKSPEQETFTDSAKEVQGRGSVAYTPEAANVDNTDTSEDDDPLNDDKVKELLDGLG
mgnify:FL=1